MVQFARKNILIYMLYCNSNHNKYIGSTDDIHNRMRVHRCHAKQLKTNCASLDLIRRNDYELVILQTMPWTTTKEARNEREQFFIDAFGTDVINRKRVLKLTMADFMDLTEE